VSDEGRRKTENRIQNSEYRTQNTASIKVETIFNRLFDLGLLDLKPCPAGRFDVCYLANLEGILTYFQAKVNKKN
jgi:hypothetical protein